MLAMQLHQAQPSPSTELRRHNMANTYKALSTTTVGAGGAATISFTNIPQTYTDLLLKVSARDSRTSNQYGSLDVTFNGSPTYSGRILYADGSTVGSTTATTNWLYGNTSISTSNTFSNCEMYIPNYTSSNNKSISSDVAVEHNASSSNSLDLIAGLATLTSAITSITITPSSGTLSQYSTATLYGIKNS
jgi:hypothetical protein